MIGDLEGRVAVVTGAARGQGRAHAVALARAGADIALCDVLSQYASVPYPMATDSDLAETCDLVEGLGRRCVAMRADVTRADEVETVMSEALAQLGRIDFVVANAGIWSLGVIGMMKTLALELAPHNIRVNALLPGMVNTDMVFFEEQYALFSPENPTLEGYLDVVESLQPMPGRWTEPEDQANAVLWLCSDESRYVTGTEIEVAAGGHL